MKGEKKLNYINDKGFNDAIELFKIRIMNNLDFDYINNLSNFIHNLYLKFKTRFDKSLIFINEYFNEYERNDIGLFQDFIFFLKNIKYVKNEIIIHTQIWEETFEPINIECPNYESKRDKLALKLEGNKLIITKYDKIFIIPNINEYTNPLILELKRGINFLDIFELTKYLKIDKYNPNIFIKTHWNELSDYFSDILISPTIKSAFVKLFRSELFFPKKEEIKQIMNNIRFFSYNIDAVAETKKKFLSTYMEVNTGIFVNNIHIKKLVYLAVFLVACIHEIIGHLFLRIHNYLSPPENKILYAKQDKLMSDYVIGEFLEEQLFGNYNFEMNIKEILYILEKANYNEVNHDNFRSKFQAISDKTVLKLSDDLKNILRLHEIDLTQLEHLGTSTKFVINKSKLKNKIKFPRHHSLSKLKKNNK